MTSDEYWQKFLKETGKDPGLKYHGEFQFGLEEEHDKSLSSLVLSGAKTAVTSSLYAFQIDMESVPKKGNYYILTDDKDSPLCVIHEINVTIMAFKDVTWEYARKEGEDQNIEQWRENHIEFFKDEAELMGYDFSEDMPVVFEEFEVVYK
ncbi:MAG: ASCH domain-containing protein [Treponema sp.]|nr:ASCH domain-containing protein [Treponema sp.]